MVYQSSLFYTIAKLTFVASLLGFILLRGIVFFFSGFMESNEKGDLYISTCFGLIYLFGSLFVLNDRIDFHRVVVFGAALNIVGAIVWVPEIGTKDTYIAVAGVLLAVLWIVFGILKFLETETGSGDSI